MRPSLSSARYERTYDILPASSTGTYFAAGALIGSTLAAGRCFNGACKENFTAK